MSMTKMLNSFDEIAKVKSISKETVIRVFKEALEKAYLKEVPDVNLEIVIDEKKGILELNELKTVVDKSEQEIDDDIEISINDEEITNSKKEYSIGDVFKSKVDIDKLERRVVAHLQNIFQQKMTELSNLNIYEEWKDKVGTIIKAEVEKADNGYIEVNLDKSVKGVLPFNEQIPKEKLIAGEHYLFLIKEIKQQTKGWPIILSRVDVKLLEFLLTREIPEIENGIIKIELVARIPGYKSKVAISCNNPNIDPVGTCVGMNGQRIKDISKELNNEKIDIILYDENPKQLLINATSPEKIIGLEITDDEEEIIIKPDAKNGLTEETKKIIKTKIVTIVCDDNEQTKLKLIGRGGINVKLLKQLTKWDIDIVPLSIAINDKIQYEDVSDMLPIKYINKQKPSFTNNNKWNNKTNKGKFEFKKDMEDSYDNSWNSSNNFIENLTDEEVENLLSINDIGNKKKKRKDKNLEDEEEVIFVSKKEVEENDIDIANDNFDSVLEDDHKNIPLQETVIQNESNDLNKETIEVQIEEKVEINNSKNETKKQEIKLDIEEEPVVEKKPKAKKTTKKSSTPKPKKEKINILDEFDISADEYDESADAIDFDDIDFDDLE